MSDYLAAVNTILSVEGVISADDDPITAFSASQHAASIRLAKRAITQELAYLVSRDFLNYERADAVLTVSARTANLASDFIRMQDEHPILIETDASGTSEGTYITEVAEEKLRRTDLKYRENTGKPYHWYWEGASSKTLGFYLVPDGTYYYRYYYEKELTVSVESDVMPFVTETEVELFLDAAGRRFKYLRSSPQVREGLFPRGLAEDEVINDARAAILQLNRHKPAPTTYGRRFR